MMFCLRKFVVDNNHQGRRKHHQLWLFHICSEAFGPVGSDMRMRWKGVLLWIFNGRHFLFLILPNSFSPHQEKSGQSTISDMICRSNHSTKVIQIFVTCVFPLTIPGTAQPSADDTCLFATPDAYLSRWPRFVFFHFRSWDRDLYLLSHLASHCAGISPFLAHLFDKIWICLNPPQVSEGIESAHMLN